MDQGIRIKKRSTWFSVKITTAYILPLIIGFFMCYGCAKKPILDSLNPSTGPRGTVVEVNGDDLLLASVKWDAGTPSERELESSFLSARFFSVPLDATIAAHPVRLYGDGQYSDATANFTVTNQVIRPAPRLDDVTVNLFGISSGSASFILMAHGANIDVGAEILVGGSAQSTFFSRCIQNTNMTATDPSTLGYHIYHYATVWCVLDGQTPGVTISVSVRNLDGATSNSLNYTIAASMDELDSDGDGLPDDWEENGYDADGDGTVDVDLPALGADPYHKDMFVEVDWMTAAAPNATIWAPIISAFANAPILNSDGEQGVALHIDRGAGTGGGGGDIIAYADRIRYDSSSPSPGFSYTNFYTEKTNHFDADRLNIYRYCIFAWDQGHSPGSSGRAEGFIANDFIVSIGSWGADGTRDEFQLSTFLHEMGHTLDLKHGGSDHTNSKDNYNSIMQYGNGWIIWAGQNNVFSPSQFGGIDVNCNQLDVDGVYTYGQGMRMDLNENHLNEFDGVCDNVSRDWNENGSIQADVAFNLDTNAALTTIRDYADWANIVIDFRAPGTQWNGN